MDAIVCSDLYNLVRNLLKMPFSRKTTLYTRGLVFMNIIITPCVIVTLLVGKRIKNGFLLAFKQQSTLYLAQLNCKNKLSDTDLNLACAHKSQVSVMIMWYYVIRMI